MFVTSSNQKNGFSVKAWEGDAKTLLAFNFTDKKYAKDLAGFSIQVKPDGKQAYYLFNSLQLPAPAQGKNAVVAGEQPNSSANAPFQKFRWLHVPGSFHQGDQVFYGKYTYTVTPRYFDANGLLKAIDASTGVSVDVPVVPFKNGNVQLGFTRGFAQSQAYAHHFGTAGKFKPADKQLLFDTTAVAGQNNAGQSFTYEQQFAWSGFTARQRIFEILKEVSADATLSIDVFAYDLNEPDILKAFLKLAGEGRIRIILDNAALHHDKTKPLPEDQFEALFIAAAKGKAGIKRGKFGRFAHDKIFIVYKNSQPLKVLTGSTNFSVTGIYVNANHILVISDADVTRIYSQVFNSAWNAGVVEAFNKDLLATSPFPFKKAGLPDMSITFSPHQAAFANTILNDMVSRIQVSKSVLFAVMDMSNGAGPVFPALAALHSDQSIFSYGISDSVGSQGVTLYKPGAKNGLLINAKPGKTVLPPPFDKEYAINMGHQIHHKFVICDFNTPDATVWCGSSNLALGGEQANGDNLIRIHDVDIATVFAIEAISLVDHFDFRDAHESGKPKAAEAPKAVKGGGATITVVPANAPPAAKAVVEGTGLTPPQLSHDLSAAVAPPKTLCLYTNDSWAQRYFDTNDLHCSDRVLFG